MKKILTGIFVSATLCAFAQAENNYSVISSGVAMENASFGIGYTIGEITVPSKDDETASLQQGVNGLTAEKAVVKDFSSALSEISISFFPNPVRNILTADISGAESSLEWTVYDINGKLISRELSTEHTSRVQINASSWASGSYVLTVGEKDGNTIGTYQIIKQ